MQMRSGATLQLLWLHVIRSFVPPSIVSSFFSLPAERNVVDWLLILLFFLLPAALLWGWCCWLLLLSSFPLVTACLRCP
jgi:hypothetical protein